MRSRYSILHRPQSSLMGLFPRHFSVSSSPVALFVLNAPNGMPEYVELSNAAQMKLKKILSIGSTGNRQNLSKNLVQIIYDFNIADVRNYRQSFLEIISVIANSKEKKSLTIPFFTSLSIDASWGNLNIEIDARLLFQFLSLEIPRCLMRVFYYFKSGHWMHNEQTMNMLEDLDGNNVLVLSEFKRLTSSFNDIMLLEDADDEHNNLLPTL
jgi:hypothetical protein